MGQLEISKLRELATKQDFVLLLGMPRSGTTATVRAFFNRFFDTVVNQPTMFNRNSVDAIDKRDRINAAANRTLGEALKTPGATIVKETVHLVLPNELDFWLSIVKLVIFVKRQPILQLESIIWMVLDKIQVAGLGSFEIDGRLVNRALDPVSFTVDGYTFFKPGTDFGHLDRVSSKDSRWEAHMTHLKKTRDYSSLDEGFKRFAILHPSFEGPDFFFTVCHSYLEHFEKRAPAEYKQALADNKASNKTDLISRYYGLRLEDFGSLPQILVDALFTWRFSSFPTLLHIKQKNLLDMAYVFDFSEYQLNSDKLINKIEKLLLKTGVTPSAELFNKEFVQCPLGTNDSITRMKFEDWETFYGYSDFRVSASGDGSIKPPKKTPIEIANFPDSLKLELRRAFYVYALLSFSPRQVIYETPMETFKKLLDVDPLTCYCLATKEVYLNGNKEADQFRRRVERTFPNLLGYYGLIDVAFIAAYKTVQDGFVDSGTGI